MTHSYKFRFFPVFLLFIGVLTFENGKLLAVSPQEELFDAQVYCPDKNNGVLQFVPLKLAPRKKVSDFDEIKTKYPDCSIVIIPHVPSSSQRNVACLNERDSINGKNCEVDSKRGEGVNSTNPSSGYFERMKANMSEIQNIHRELERENTNFQSSPKNP